MNMKWVRVAGALTTPLLGPLGIVAILAATRKWYASLGFDRRLLLESLFVSSLFVLGYGFAANEVLLRAPGLILINLLLIAAVRTRAWSASREAVIDAVYLINLAILVLSFFVQPLAELLSRSGTDTSRLGGLLGYDFVAFFVAVYLVTRINSGALQGAGHLFIHLGFALFVTLNSGRFGFIIMMVLAAFILTKYSKIKVAILVSILAAAAYWFGGERLPLILSTLRATIEFLIYNDEAVFAAISAESAVGFYAASPLTWIGEFRMAFANLPAHFLPSSAYFGVDNGPAYMVLNAGLLLALAFYYLLFRFLKVAGVTNIFIIAIFILTDLKFRSAFSVFPMLWLYLNSHGARGQAVRRR